MQQRGFISGSSNSCSLRGPIRFEIGFIFFLLKARSLIRTATYCDPIGFSIAHGYMTFRPMQFQPLTILTFRNYYLY